MGRWVHLGSSGLFGHALSVVSIIGVRWVRLGAPWMSSGSFGDAMQIVGFIQVLSARSGALWWSSDSFGLVGFILARQVGRRVHSGSLGSRVFGFIRVRLVHSGVT